MSGKRLHDDFNGDGYADAAIGAPGTALGEQRGAGAVTVLYGSAKGLSTARKQVLTWPGRKNAQSPQGGYGSDLRTADLDEDGYADLLSAVTRTPRGRRARHLRPGQLGRAEGPIGDADAADRAAGRRRAEGLRGRRRGR
ncbi:integrin alpha [Streptomyces tricolor]|nr:integrin alpha [Streptomyces tricolor]